MEMFPPQSREKIAFQIFSAPKWTVEFSAPHPELQKFKGLFVMAIYHSGNYAQGEHLNVSNPRNYDIPKLYCLVYMGSL